MMKLAVPALTLILVLNSSQASTTAAIQEPVYRKHSASLNPTRTKSVLARAVPKYKRQVLTTNLGIDDNDDPAGSDELDIYVGYRRPELTKVINVDTDNDELSDYVQTRLLVARARALKKYQEVWG